MLHGLARDEVESWILMRARERGSAMLVTMIIVAALLGGAAVLASVTIKATRGSEMTRKSMTALYCAESGIAVARDAVASNYAAWNASLGETVEPAWLAGIEHDIDGDGNDDFMITLRDNDDEATNQDLTRDNDLSIYVVSTCTKDPEIATSVVELVRYNGGGNCYQSQLGGCGGNNNANSAN
jgi:hypothetical protein